MKRIEAIALALAVTIFPAAADAACQLSLLGAIAQQPLSYSPFQAGATTAEVTFTLSNADSKPCDAAFAFFSTAPLKATAASEELTYQLLGQGGSLAQIAPNPPATLPGTGGASFFTVGAKQTYTANAMLSVDAGQVVSAGAYSGALYLGIYQSTGGGQYTKASIPAALLAVTIGVSSQMTVALAGGGRRTTLSFGDIVEGAVRSVQLLAYANQGFRLIVSSDNGGVMKPVDAAASAEGGWRVPYTTMINKSAPFNLTQQRTLALWPSATKKSGISIPIEVQVGSAAGQRAGVYRDVITIAIDAGP